MNSVEYGPPKLIFRVVQGMNSETAVCEFPEGSGGPGGRFVLLSITGGEEQRAYLDAVGQRFPVSYDGNRLQAFLPYREGQSFSVWEAETQPGYRERRLVCLQILQGLLEEWIPEELFVKMLSPDNICLCREGARLQYFPDFSGDRWPRLSGLSDVSDSGGVAAPSAYSELAALFYELLNTAVGMTPDNAGRCPPEYRLLRERAWRKEYHTPDQLFRDLNALPEDFSLRCPVFSLLSRKQAFREPILRRVANAILLLLTLVAVFCVVTAAMRGMKSDETGEPFTGMVQIGDQILTGG